MWCYQRQLKIKCAEMISNDEVLQRMKEKEMHLYNSTEKQKMAYAGHALCECSSDKLIMDFKS